MATMDAPRVSLEAPCASLAKEAINCAKKVYIAQFPVVVHKGTLYEDIDAALEKNPPVWKEAPPGWVEPPVVKLDNSKVRLEPHRRQKTQPCQQPQSQERQKEHKKPIEIRDVDRVVDQNDGSDEVYDLAGSEQSEWMEIAERLPKKKGRVRNDILGKRAMALAGIKK